MYSNETGLPSVTETLKPWIDTRWFTEESAVRGNYAHDRVFCHLTYSMFMEPKNEMYEVYFRSFLKFEPRIKEVILAEERLADHDLGFCGQPDLTFQDEDGLICLGDWKTAKAIYKYWPMQLGGYSILLKTQKNIHADKGMIIRLRDDDGKDPLINVYSISECERLFRNNLEIFKLLK